MTLLDDLRAAERGSPELGARVLTAVTGEEHNCACGIIVKPDGELASDPTSSTDAAIQLVESKDMDWALCPAGGRYSASVGSEGGGLIATCHTPALALCAALIAAMGVK